MRRLAALLALLLLAASPSRAEYPERPVRLVVPFPPGGPTDIFARLIAQGLTAKLGQQVVVENKGGAGGNVGTEAVAKAKADGYTLLFGTAGTHGINISLYKQLEYDPVKDFAAIALVGIVPQVLLAASDQPDTVRGLIAKLKADPGKYSYGSAGNGTTNHLSGELFKKLAGVDVTHVPYRGTGPAMQDLLARRLAYLFGSFGPAAEYIKSGQMRALAVCSAKRSAVAPDVPTMAEAGVPNFESATWNVVVAPAGTPPAVVERLNRAVNEVVKAPAMADRLRALNMEPADDFSPAATKAFIEAEIKQWRAVVELSGARID
ncbi:MAG: Bug family tripartite tricarboxylate transporter substrate binding protein [Reyranellales bacterium]